MGFKSPKKKIEMSIINRVAQRAGTDDTEMTQIENIAAGIDIGVEVAAETDTENGGIGTGMMSVGKMTSLDQEENMEDIERTGAGVETEAEMVMHAPGNMIHREARVQKGHIRSAAGVRKEIGVMIDIVDDLPQASGEATVLRTDGDVELTAPERSVTK